MKKIVLIIAIMTFPIFAQDITNKLGGDTANETYDITNSSDNILVRVQGDGKVGIGTPTPDELLHVDGNIRIDGTYEDKDGDAGASGQILSSTASGTNWIDAPSGSAGNTLDQAYDQGAAGAGRIITADNGAFEVGGVDGVLFSGARDSGTIPATGAGTRMMWFPKKAAFRAGYVDGDQWDADSIGNYSIAMGGGTLASGDYSTAMGVKTNANGKTSTAMGAYTYASGYSSTAMGGGTLASGDYSTAMGNGTTASGESSTVVGQFNMVNNDALFIVGNGIHPSRSNAFEVDIDGDAWIENNLYVGTGISTNDDDIYFDDGTEYLRWDESSTRYDFSDELRIQGDLRVGTHDGTNDDNIFFDDGAEYLRWDNSATEFDFSDDVDISGELEADELWSKLGTSTMYRLTTTYGFSQEVYWTTSDKRMKKNIKPITSPLEKLQLLNGVTYDWNKKAKDYFTKDIKENVRPNESLSESEKEAIWEEERQKVLDEAERRKMSFIAQEVEEHFPEWVKENEDGIKEIDMKGLDAVLVEAIKELTMIVEEQDKRIAELELQLSK